MKRKRARSMYWLPFDRIAKAVLSSWTDAAGYSLASTDDVYMSLVSRFGEHNVPPLREVAKRYRMFCR